MFNNNVFLNSFGFTVSIFLSALLEGVQNNDVAATDRALQCDKVGRKNFNVNGSLYDSLLHVAARSNSYEICKMLLKYGADVNISNLEDQTPLHVAERNTNYSLCQLLHKKQRCKEERINYMKQMHICAKKNDLITCKKFISSINVNETDEKMRTPLHVAVIFSGEELCELLLEHGADVNAKDSYNDSPIQLAFYYRRNSLREKFLTQLAYFG